jgi:Tol biopolymer transport system component
LANTPLADATRMDSVGRFSPDGLEIAFVSDRGGSQQVWIPGRDGTRLRSVTRLADATMTVGSWSPDGEWIAFDATVAGATDLYAARVDGGELRRLTESPANEVDPDRSDDGSTIFFSSNESGTPTIWRMPAGGGQRTQLTTKAGFEPRQSPDGRSLYFIDQPRRFSRSVSGTLKQVTVDGGLVSTVHRGVTAGAWDVTDRGVVFVIARNAVVSPDTPDTLAIYEYADQRQRILGTLSFPVAPAFTTRFLIASPDGAWAVVGRMDRFDRDIMVVENFR